MSAASVTFNAIASDASFVASDLSHTNGTAGNFQRITAAINRGALNSDNYSASGFLSQHIGVGEVNSLHISNNAVVSAKISQTAIQDEHLQKVISAGGVRAVRIGPGAGSAGVKCAMFSKAQAISIATWAATDGASSNSQYVTSFNINFQTDTVDYSPSFTATPVLMGGPCVSFGAASSANHPFNGFCVFGIDSVSVDIGVYHPAVGNYSANTIYLEAAGAAATA